MALTALQAEVSKTSTFNGSGVDISALASPLSIEVTVDSLTAGSTAIFQIQTSADSFSADIRVEKTMSFFGPAANTAPQTRVTHDYDMPGFRNGVTSANVRLALTYLDGATTVKYSSYITN